jgi:hypothetical protein
VTTTTAPTLQRIDGQLFVDMDNYRARYECYRAECPHPLEGPVRATDRDAGNKRIGAEGVASFIAGAKDRHLNTHHGSLR